MNPPRTATALLVAVLAGACRHPAADPPSPAVEQSEELEVRLTPAEVQSAGLRVGRARSGPRRSVVSAAGTIEFVPRNVARVGPLIEGRVLALRVEPGQHVEAGATLATVQSFEVGRSRAELVTAQVRAQQAEVELNRQRTMSREGATSTREVVAAESENTIARLQLAAARQRMGALGASGQGAGYSSVPLTTPIAGVVLQVDARVGQTVGATDTLFVVGRTEQVWLVADVYERDYARVHEGDEARVSLVAYPGRAFTGRVENVGGIMDPTTRAAPVRIALDNPDGALRPGMSAQARILGRPAPGETVVSVPRGAVQTIDGQPYVFVERGAGRFEARPVERGAEVDGDVEIAHGLADAEPIATEGTFVLKSEVLREQMGSND